VILQRAGDDLRRRGRPAIDEHHDRQASGDIAGSRIIALRVLASDAARRDVYLWPGVGEKGQVAGTQTDAVFAPDRGIPPELYCCRLDGQIDEIADQLCCRPAA